MKGYKFIEDLTSDVMFEAYGKDLKETFTNAAEALFSVICQKGKVGDSVRKELVVEGDDEKDLLVNWLQELIARVDIENLFFSRFEITSISRTKLKAVVYGEEADPQKGGTVVKAVTYYKLSIEETEKGWTARVALDI
jgi:SHS2 domain-containing protein